MPTHKARTTLLLVDDDAPLRLLLTMILDHSGYEVRVANDGFSALREIKASHPETILSDLNMPGMSGFELLSVVRRRFPAIRVIAMSAAFPGREIPAGVAADAFYHKGGDLDDLLSLLELTPLGEHIYRTQELDAAVPLWISQEGRDKAGGICVTLTCPECLRTFPQIYSEVSFPVRETECIYCSSTIRYAIVQPADTSFSTAPASGQEESSIRRTA